jgi:hypothetical protein
MLFGILVILNLGSREDTSVDDSGLRFDFQAPIVEVLAVR